MLFIKGDKCSPENYHKALQKWATADIDAFMIQGCIALLKTKCPEARDFDFSKIVNSHDPLVAAAPKMDKLTHLTNSLIHVRGYVYLHYLPQVDIFPAIARNPVGLLPPHSAG